MRARRNFDGSLKSWGTYWIASVSDDGNYGITSYILLKVVERAKRQKHDGSRIDGGRVKGRKKRAASNC